MADSSSRAGERYISPEILQYLNDLHAPHDAALSRAFDAPGATGIPAIQVGASEGKLLTLLLRLAAAKKVVELGTLAGYSGLRILRALPKDGHLWTCEFDPKHADIAQKSFDRAGETARVTIVRGKGAETLPSIEQHGPFDAVFIDADKGNYDVYGRWAAKHVRPGGLLLVDNANYFGKLLDDTEEAKAVRRCHEEAKASFDTVCIPTPDGLLLGIKK